MLGRGGGFTTDLDPIREYTPIKTKHGKDKLDGYLSRINANSIVDIKIVESFQG